MKKISVLGAGSWGTALSMVLADKGYEVNLLTIIEEQCNEINEKRTNHAYLKDIVLPEKIKATLDLEECVKDADFLIMSVPSSAVRAVAKNIAGLLDKKTIVINTAKGIEPHTLLRLSEVINQEIPDIRDRLVVLSGPSHAEEVALRMPTAIVAASENHDAALKAQDLFMSEKFRVYTNPDVVGVEAGGSLKNVIALATGISDGLGYGDNTRAALITRGIAEIAKLGKAMGANPLTFTGLSGMGDLVVTCNSMHSRNRRAGIAIGKGGEVKEILESMGMVVEGVRTAEAILELNKKYHVDMPISMHVYDLIFGDLKLEDVVSSLMTRAKKQEVEEFWIDGNN